MTNRPMTFSSLNWGKKWVSLFPNKLGKNHICLSTLSQSAQKTQIAQFFCALWVKAHSARGGRGVNRKHHPSERCDLRFGSQSAVRMEMFSKRTEKFEITLGSPCSRLCNLEEQVLKCSIFCESDAAQRLSFNSEAPVLTG